MRVKYPCLIQKQFCTTEMTLRFDGERLNEYGEPEETKEYTGRCNYQDRAKTVMTAEKRLVVITGTALFPGDICPDYPVISGGTAVVHGEERRILQGKKARNPDGSVNFVEVMLI